MDAFLGMIQSFGFNFPPRGWALCQGQLLSVSSNTALFALLGTYYGGNGQTTFALPDLQGRVAIGMGAGAGLSPYQIGQKAGAETTTLTIAQMPAHNHSVVISGTMKASSSPGTTNKPTATVNTLAMLNDASSSGYDNSAYNNATPDITLNAGTPTGTVGINGGSQPFSNVQPYLAINYSIALQGIFPSRD